MKIDLLHISNDQSIDEFKKILINGTKLTKLEELQAQGINPTHLIEVGVQCSLRQLLEHGFFHADPHPGNLLATPDGKLAIPRSEELFINAAKKVLGKQDRKLE